MPPTTRRRRNAKKSAPETGAGHQSQELQSRIRKVTLRVLQPKTSNPDPRSATPASVPPPLPLSPASVPPLLPSPEMHEPPHGATPVLPPLLPPPETPPLQQHPHVPHLTAGHPASVGRQFNAHDLGMSIPPLHANPYMPFYPPPTHPQLQYPSHIPLHYGTRTSAPFLQSQHDFHYPTLPPPFISQLLATQYPNTNVSLPAHEVQHRPGRPMREGSLTEVDAVATAASSSVDARPGKTYPNKYISTGGRLLYLHEVVLVDVLKCGSL